ncbi:zinc-ribbon domain-containing protein [Actinomadura citrea]|nr:zinc-ribbon domain-containing protein [Actinomadura citrea]
MRKIAMIIRRAMNVDQIPCSACGTYNSENAKVCQGCGTRIG